jgi:very-short-patch-repair endonuclease
VVVHRSAIPDDERTVVAGIPVTTVPRTVLDYAAVVSGREVERALNEIEVRQLRDALSIRDLLDRHPRRRGSAVVRELLDSGAEAAGVTKRELEERFAVVVEREALPRPRRNADIEVRGRFFNVDCLWPEARFAVELDGRAVHGTHKAFESDRGRDRMMVAEGWRVMRITWAQLRDEEAAVVADIRAALGLAPLRFVG